jgi:hypothetical protein
MLNNEFNSCATIPRAGGAPISNSQRLDTISAEKFISEKKYIAVESMLINACQYLETYANNFFKENSEINKWWVDKKEEERQLKIEKENQLKEAKRRVEEISRRQKKYLKYLLDEDLEVEDREYFQKRISNLRDEIEYISGIYPELLEDHQTKK